MTGVAWVLLCCGCGTEVLSCGDSADVDGTGVTKTPELAVVSNVGLAVTPGVVTTIGPDVVRLWLVIKDDSVID